MDTCGISHHMKSSVVRMRNHTTGTATAISASSSSTSSSSSSSSSSNLQLHQQQHEQLQTISLHIDEWCRNGTILNSILDGDSGTSVIKDNAPSTTLGTSINATTGSSTSSTSSSTNQTSTTTITSITVRQLIEQEWIPFLKTLCCENDGCRDVVRRVVSSTGAIRTTDPTETTLPPSVKTSSMTSSMIQQICTVVLRQPWEEDSFRPLSTSLPTLLLLPRRDTDDIPSQLEPQLQKQQHRRILHVQLLLRLVLLQWLGPRFVQVYNRMYHHHNTKQTKNSMTKTKSKKKKEKKTKKSQSTNQISALTPFLHDMIQLLQAIALRLLPQEQFVHFVQTECTFCWRDCSITRVQRQPTSHCPESNQWFFLLLRPVWDYFEIKNPYRTRDVHHDNDDDNDDTMEGVRTEPSTSELTATTTTTTRKRRRKISPAQSSLPTALNTAPTTTKTTTSHLSLKPMALRKNPLLQDKTTFIGHHFNTTTNHYYSTTTTHRSTDRISQLFRQVPVSVVGGKGTNTTKPLLSLQHRPKQHTAPVVTPLTSSTTTINILPPPPPLTSKDKMTTKSTVSNRTRQPLPSNVPLELNDKENVSPLIPLEVSSHKATKQLLTSSTVLVPIMSVIPSSSLPRHTGSTGNTTGTSTTRHLVSEAMEALQRRKERHRQQHIQSKRTTRT